MIVYITFYYCFISFKVMTYKICRPFARSVGSDKCMSRVMSFRGTDVEQLNDKETVPVAIQLNVCTRVFWVLRERFVLFVMMMVGYRYGVFIQW